MVINIADFDMNLLLSTGPTIWGAYFLQEPGTFLIREGWRSQHFAFSIYSFSE